MQEEPVKVARTFRWEMGHRLPYHSGGCENVHGHSYKMEVEIQGKPDEKGMVLDFYDIDAIVKPLLDKMDHAFMCTRSDELMVQFFQNAGLKVIYVDFYSTVENIARFVLSHIKSALAKYPNVESVTIRLFETRTEYAEIQAFLKLA